MASWRDEVTDKRKYDLIANIIETLDIRTPRTHSSNEIDNKLINIASKYFFSVLEMVESQKDMIEKVAIKLYDIRQKHAIQGQQLHQPRALTAEQKKLINDLIANNRVLLPPPKTPESLRNITLPHVIAVLSECHSSYKFAQYAAANIDVWDNFFKALKDFDESSLIAQLKLNPSLIKLQNAQGQNAFHLVFIDKQLPAGKKAKHRMIILRELIEVIAKNKFDYSALINQVDCNGCTPLHYAAKNATPPTLKIFTNLSLGNVDEANLKGEYPIDVTGVSKKKDILRLARKEYYQELGLFKDVKNDSNQLPKSKRQLDGAKQTSAKRQAFSH